MNGILIRFNGNIRLKFDHIDGCGSMVKRIENDWGGFELLNFVTDDETAKNHRPI